MIAVMKLAYRTDSTEPLEYLWFTSGSWHLGTTADPRVMGETTFDQNLFTSNALHGQPDFGVGSVTISNTDGKYDWMGTPTNTADGYTQPLVNGEVFEIYVVPSETSPLPDDPYLTARISYIEFGWDSFTVYFRDRSQDLAIPVAPYTFEQTLLVDPSITVDPSTVGNRAQRVIGRCLNAPAILLNRPALLYGVNFGPGGAGAFTHFWSLYDKGGKLKMGEEVESIEELMDASPAPGHYVVCRSLGMFRLGTVPRGQVTADVASGTDSENVPDVLLKALFLESIEGGDFDLPRTYNKSELEACWKPHYIPCGYLATTETYLEVMQEILDSYGCFMVPDRTGIFRFGRLRSDMPAPVKTFNHDLWYKGTIKRLIPGVPDGIPISQAVVQHDRVWQTLSDTSVLESLEPSRKAVLSQAYRSTVANSGTKVYGAGPEVFTTCLVTEPEVQIFDTTFYAYSLWWDADATNVNFTPEGANVSILSPPTVVLSQPIATPVAWGSSPLPRYEIPGLGTYAAYALEADADPSNPLGAVATARIVGADPDPASYNLWGMLPDFAQSFYLSSGPMSVEIRTSTETPYLLRSIRVTAPSYRRYLRDLVQEKVDLFGGDMLRLEFACSLEQAEGIRLGHTVEIESPRFSLDQGNSRFYVVGRKDQIESNRVTLDVWRPSTFTLES